STPPYPGGRPTRRPLFFGARALSRVPERHWPGEGRVALFPSIANETDAPETARENHGLDGLRHPGHPGGALPVLWRGELFHAAGAHLGGKGGRPRDQPGSVPAALRPAPRADAPDDGRRLRCTQLRD